MREGHRLAPPARDLLALWRARPPYYSRAVWPLLLLLDTLPHPWGEDLLAWLFVVKTFVQTRRLRAALSWAAAQSRVGPARWRLALSCCAYQGRFVARMALVGVRDPAHLRQRVTIRGADNLEASGGPTILLGFHLGPPQAGLALKLAGHRVTWLVVRGHSRAWSREAWRPLQAPDEIVPLSDDRSASGVGLYRAHRILGDGGTIFISADGGGEEALRVLLPGSALSVRSGWLALRRRTHARVLPVLTQMEGRTQVVTIHPALPAPTLDPAADLTACRDILDRLLRDYVRRFPEQCSTIVFPPHARTSAPR